MQPMRPWRSRKDRSASWRICRRLSNRFTRAFRFTETPLTGKGSDRRIAALSTICRISPPPTKTICARTIPSACVPYRWKKSFVSTHLRALRGSLLPVLTPPGTSEIGPTALREIFGLQAYAAGTSAKMRMDMVSLPVASVFTGALPRLDAPWCPFQPAEPNASWS